MDTAKNLAASWQYEDYIKLFEALSNPMRMKIIGILAQRTQYVSELARILNISRPLLYMHLKKLELAELVTSHLEISELGKATKYYELVPFQVQITTELLADLSKNISVVPNENQQKKEDE